MVCTEIILKTLRLHAERFENSDGKENGNVALIPQEVNNEKCYVKWEMRTDLLQNNKVFKDFMERPSDLFQTVSQ